MRLPSLLLTALLMTSSCCRAEVIVIVSARSPVKSLSDEQATDLFLGKSADFPNGQHATPVDQSEGSQARNAFYLKASGKDPAQMKAYWARMLFTGRGQPPVEAGDSEAIKRLVAGNPNLIGYIDRSALDASVRAVLSLH